MFGCPRNRGNFNFKHDLATSFAAQSEQRSQSVPTRFVDLVFSSTTTHYFDYIGDNRSYEGVSLDAVPRPCPLDAQKHPSRSHSSRISQSRSCGTSTNLARSIRPCETNLRELLICEGLLFHALCAMPTSIMWRACLELADRAWLVAALPN
jgi:hypothetical protein